jgi:hypothetical protein
MIEYTATLNQSSSRYHEWRKIFDVDQIPLAAPLAPPGRNPFDETQTRFYIIDHTKLAPGELRRLLAIITTTLRCSDAEGMQYLEMRGGYLIPQEDVIVKAVPQTL